MTHIKKDFFIVPNWLLELNTLTYSEKLVLLHLIRRADGKSKCFPRAYLICQGTGLSRNTVFKALKSLEGHKYIHIERRHRRTSVFTVLNKTFDLDYHRKASEQLEAYNARRADIQRTKRKRLNKCTILT